MAQSSEFQPSQMLYLDCNNNRLFTELIQTIKSRGLSWVRPLALETLESVENSANDGWPLHRLVDLRGGSDLLMPTELFHAAIDVELIPILAELNSSRPTEGSDRHAHNRLQQFVHQVCQLYPDAF